MEQIAAFLIASSADARRMSAGRLDGPVEIPRGPSRWRRAARALAGAARPNPPVRKTAARTASAKTAASGSAGCATA